MLAAANIALKGGLKKDDLVQLAVNCLQIKVPGMDDVSSTSVLSSATTAMDTEVHQTLPPGQVQQNAASSESSHQALEDTAVNAAAKADSSITSVLISASSAMDSAAHQTLPPGQVQQNAASSESSHQALGDVAVNAAAKADSSITSVLITATSAMDTEAHQTQSPGQVQQIAASSDSSITSDLILFTLSAGDIFTLRIEEYILSDKPTVRKDCRVLRIDQHPRLKRQVQIWYSYTWTARNGVTHHEDDGVLDIVFQDGMSN